LSHIIVAGFSTPRLSQFDELCAELALPYRYATQLEDIDPSLLGTQDQGSLDLLITGDTIDIEHIENNVQQLSPNHWLALCDHDLEKAAALGRAGADLCVSADDWKRIKQSINSIIKTETTADTAPNPTNSNTEAAAQQTAGRDPSSLSSQPEALDNEPPAGLIGRCPSMQEVYSRIYKVGPTKSTVLIRGETGTGKELIARAIHECSDRADKPFVAINCAAIPETLIESELFGHEKGAFTGAAGKRVGLIEEAESGTLFLDEIGELPAEAQARLLRFIQESEVRSVGSNKSRKVDVRLIAATHRDLQSQAKSGQFRADLYYRINVFRIFLPLLRDRGDDIFEIAQHLLERAAARHNKPGLKLAPDAINAIGQHSWQGNVRELENTIERAAIMASDALITHADLELEYSPNQRPNPYPRGGESSYSSNANNEHSHSLPLTLDEAADKAISSMSRQHSEKNSTLQFTEPKAGVSMEDYFQQFVLENQERMNETELAKMLGISRKCLWERRQRYGIPRKNKDKEKKA